MRNHVWFLGLLFVATLLIPEWVQAEEKTFPTKPQPIGYFQLDYYSGDSGKTDTEEKAFLIRRARMGVKGELNEMISYQLLGAFDGPNDPTKTSTAQLFDAWANLNLNPLFQIRAGQFKYNFDREGKMSGSSLPFATRAAVVNDLVSKLGKDGGSFRDIGIEIYGGQKEPIGWGYTIGAINGNGINLYDDNDKLDIYLRGTIDPVKGVSFGVGYYTGESETESGTPVVVSEQDERILTVDGMFEMGPVALMAAFYQAKFEPQSGADIEPKGWYALGSYRILSNVDVLLRYQSEDQDSNVEEKQLSSFDIGVNYYVSRKGTWDGVKLALNYMMRDAEDAAKTKVWEERGAEVMGEDVENLFIARLQVTLP